MPLNLCRAVPTVYHIVEACSRFLETVCGISIGSLQTRRTLECPGRPSRTT